MKAENIIVSRNSFESDDLYDVVYSNVTVINLLLDEGVKEEDMHKDALCSYYADYYLAQVNNGGFSQYVYNSKWQSIVNERVALGLEQMKALAHLRYFKQKRAIIDQFPKGKLEEYIGSEYFGESTTRNELNDDTFYNIKENIVDLNAIWLKNHPDTLVLSIDDMFLALEKITGKSIER